MRRSSSVAWGLFVVAMVVSAVLWWDLRAERQLVSELRTQLEASRAEVPAEGASVTAAAVVPAPGPSPGAAPGEATATASTPVPAERNAQLIQEALSAAVQAELARRNAESPDVQATRARSNARRQNVSLATDLGLSVAEADALFNILGESGMRREAKMLELMTNAQLTEEQRQAEMLRVQEELRQQEKTAITASLGAERYAQVKEYQETQPSRVRVTNFSGMLASRGAALTEAQSKSLSSVIIAEQRRQEGEGSSAIPTSASARVEREIDSDRRILAAASEFLTAQQMEFMSSKFEELWEGKRAALRR